MEKENKNLPPQEGRLSFLSEQRRRKILIDEKYPIVNKKYQSTDKIFLQVLEKTIREFLQAESGKTNKPKV